MTTPTKTVIFQDPLSDEEVVARVLAGETSMFEIVMRRYNQRLYRVARAILRNDGEAEDVMQDAYVRGIGSELNGKIEAALAVSSANRNLARDRLVGDSPD